MGASHIKRPRCLLANTVPLMHREVARLRQRLWRIAFDPPGVTRRMSRGLPGVMSNFAEPVRLRYRRIAEMKRLKDGALQEGDDFLDRLAREKRCAFVPDAVQDHHLHLQVRVLIRTL